MSTAHAQSLVNPGFEGSYNSIQVTGASSGRTVTGSTANGWADNSSWAPNVSIHYEQDTQIRHSGASSQKIEVRKGFAHFGQAVQFRSGYTSAGVWLRSDSPILVTLSLRLADKPYTEYAAQVAVVGHNWTRASVTGITPAVDGTFSIMTPDTETGTLWVDDASLTSGQSEPALSLTPPASAIPLTYFGLHVNHHEEAPHISWPSFPFGTTRSLNCAQGFWANIEPNPPVHGVHTYSHFGPLDDFVRLATAHHERIIYSVYMTPPWATDDKTGDGYSARGGAGNPRNLSDYASFLTMIVKRYPGKIAAFEAWNEPDQTTTWHGTPAQMVQIEKTCAEVVHHYAPGALVLSPPISTTQVASQALWLQRFLANGGTKYSNIEAEHFYAGNPEQYVWAISVLRKLLADYGDSGKPIWDTEAGWGFDGPAATDKGDRQPMSLSIAYLARSYVLDWALGAKCYCWYFYNELSNTGVRRDSSGHYTVPTAGTLAYIQLEKWLTGAVMLSCSRDAHGTWVSVIKRPHGYRGYILWNPDKTTAYSVPAKWHIVRQRDLYATSSKVNGSQPFSVRRTPVLLENSTPRS